MSALPSRLFFFLRILMIMSIAVIGVYSCESSKDSTAPENTKAEARKKGEPETVVKSDTTPDFGISGDSVYYLEAENDKALFKKVNVAGGTPTTIKEEAAPKGATLLTVDSKNFYWVKNKDYGFDIMMTPIAGGESKQIAYSRYHQGHFAYDQSHIYYNAEDKEATTRIWKVSRDGGEPVVVGKSSISDDAVVDDTHIYWSSRSSKSVKPYKIFRMKKDGGKGEREEFYEGGFKCTGAERRKGKCSTTVGGLACDDKYLYIAGGSFLSKVDKSNGKEMWRAPKPIYSGELALSDKYVLLLQHTQQSPKLVPGQVHCYSKDDPENRKAIAGGLSHPHEILVAGDYVYWSRHRRIGRRSLKACP